MIEQEARLSPHEAAVIAAFMGSDAALTLEEIAENGKIDVAQARSAVERLKLKAALIQTGETQHTRVALTEAGQTYAVEQLPEMRLVATLRQEGSILINQLQQREDMSRAEAGGAFGALRKAGVLHLHDGYATLADDAELASFVSQQALLAQIHAVGEVDRTTLSPQEHAWLQEKRLRDLVKLTTTKVRTYQLTAAGVALQQEAAQAKDEISRLSPTMLQDGSWQGKRFRPYNIGLPPRLVAGARNPYRRFLDKTKQTLLGLGFEEMRGSLVENEFWNMDALFMPQFHPARDIHDAYYVAAPTHSQGISEATDELAESYLSNVAATHEGHGASGSHGWGYCFDKERTRRLVLRSQGTALSVRQLANSPNIPGKYFSMARCFRYDAVDATHAPDFIQIEGIILSENMTLRHLLGMLMIFAREVAQAEEIKAVPAYFPYTEPSVEVHMKHPELGWIELGGSGIFRPEVTEPLGINVPVIAWGLGLDRMAMMALGERDIRNLFTNNLPHGVGDARLF